MGDGIGVEDPDFENDVLNGQPEKYADAAASAKNTNRNPLPSWLMTKFREHVEASNKRDGNRLPPLYAKHQTFWFPSKSPFFSLLQKQVTPQCLFNPRFFLWDPEPLVFGGIPCPMCGQKLMRHGHVERPHRCIDLYDTFWIIGYRYHCSSCLHPISKKATVTFNSWDTHIISNLPPHLAAEFPVRLSFRSGISFAAFGFMRSCFQNGMGAKQFSDALRVQHLQHYDELHLQYLQAIAVGSKLKTWLHQAYEPFPKFEDQSLTGFHGYVPSAQWLHGLYDEFIEEHQQELVQHTAMLSGEICSIDHSFKVCSHKSIFYCLASKHLLWQCTKHIAKVNGVPTYPGLLTVTNEKGEIRVCALVATKSHSQFEIALKKMQESLHLYGHAQPSIFILTIWLISSFWRHHFPL